MEYVRLVFADLNGAMKGKIVPKAEFDPSARYGMPRSVLLQDIEGEENPTVAGFTPESGDTDMMLVPDMNTMSVAPGNDNLEQVIVDTCDSNGSQLEEAPRTVLKRVLNRLTERGYEVRVASELEFYLLKNDGALYDANELEQPYGDINALDKLGGLLSQLVEGTATIGLKPEAVLSESGPGQMEINFRPSSPLDMADRTFYFKQMVREVARKQGFQATFLAKPFAEHSGSGYHLHLSLWRDGRNVFAEQPEILEAFAAGNIRHGGELYALFAPGPNSYRRVQLSHGYVPSSMSHAEDDRRTALRVLGEAESRRIEHRVCGSDANPYLLIAAVLAAGIKGIENNLRVSNDEVQGYTKQPFVDNLPQALDMLHDSELARESLGRSFVEAFTSVKDQEWKKFQAQITSWEKTTYGSVV